MNSKPLHIGFNKIDVFIRPNDGARYFVLFEVKNMIPFRTGLDIL